MRTICIVTGARSEFGLLKPVIDEVQTRTGLGVQLVVAGMHLSTRHGYTVQEIEAAGLGIDARVDMLPEGDAPAAMAAAVGRGIIGFTAAFQTLRPDIVVVLGDRIEAFAAATAASLSKIVVAHIHGGDRSRGGFDEHMRHAITKLAHVHFAACGDSAERIMKLGEPPERVHTVGAPGLDTILASKIAGCGEFRQAYNFDPEKPFILVVQHPVSTQSELAADQMRQTLDAVTSFDMPVVIVYPNNDAGAAGMIDVIEGYRSWPDLHIYQSVPRSFFLTLLARSHVLVGNSSCGIIEAPSFKIPVVNIGIRQDGRFRASNVIDVPVVDADDIREAIEMALNDKNFRRKLARCQNPYGEGKASQAIVDVLESLDITPELFEKQITF